MLVDTDLECLREPPLGQHWLPWWNMSFDCSWRPFKGSSRASQWLKGPGVLQVFDVPFFRTSFPNPVDSSRCHCSQAGTIQDNGRASIQCFNRVWHSLFGKGNKTVWQSMPELTFPLQLISGPIPTTEMISTHTPILRKLRHLCRSCGVSGDDIRNVDASRPSSFTKENTLITCR